MAQHTKSNKREYVKLTSPRGSFKWPKLSEPDYGSDKFPKPDGEYSVKLTVHQDDPAVKALIRKLQPLQDEAVAAGKAQFRGLKVETRKKLGDVSVNNFYSVIYDEETEEPTGEIDFKFSMKASGEYKKGPKAGQRWNRSPVIFDARGVVMKKAPDIWGGTIGKIGFSVEKGGYFIPGTGAVGIKLALDAVQIIDLVSGGQRQASDFGFGKEEGYEHAETDESADADDDDDVSFRDETASDDEGDF